MVELFGLGYRCCHFSPTLQKTTPALGCTCEVYYLYRSGLLGRHMSTSAKSGHGATGRSEVSMDSPASKFGLSLPVYSTQTRGRSRECFYTRSRRHQKKYKNRRTTKVTENGPKTNRRPTHFQLSHMHTYPMRFRAWSWRYVAPAGGVEGTINFGSWNPQKTLVAKIVLLFLLRLRLSSRIFCDSFPLI